MSLQGCHTRRKFSSLTLELKLTCTIYNDVIGGRMNALRPDQLADKLEAGASNSLCSAVKFEVYPPSPFAHYFRSQLTGGHLLRDFRELWRMPMNLTITASPHVALSECLPLCVLFLFSHLCFNQQKASLSSRILTRINLPPGTFDCQITAMTNTKKKKKRFLQ